jgi:hypothetical protein
VVDAPETYLAAASAMPSSSSSSLTRANTALQRPIMPRSESNRSAPVLNTDKLSTNSQGTEGWQFQRNKSKKRTRQGVRGSDTRSTVRTRQKLYRQANIFATNFLPEVNAEELKKDLEKNLEGQVYNNLNVEAVKTKYPTYKSFKVTALCEDPLIFMDEKIWPEQAWACWWRKSKRSPPRVQANPASDVADTTSLNRRRTSDVPPTTESTDKQHGPSGQPQ